MVNEMHPPTPVPPGDANPGSSSLPYAGLRWVIRLTGVLLMFGGTIYLGIVAGRLLFGTQGHHTVGAWLYALVISLIALGLGIYVLRIGLNMLCSVDAASIGSFSFLFSLVYISILVQILPSAEWFSQRPIEMGLFFLLCLACSYFVLRYILLALLFPKRKS